MSSQQTACHYTGGLEFDPQPHVNTAFDGAYL